MSTYKPDNTSTSIWFWIGWIVLTIGAFFVAVWIWTPIIAKHFGSVRSQGATLAWIIAVFGTWLAVLAPLMVLMYWKVDKAYEDARIRREMRAEKIQTPSNIKTQSVSDAQIQVPEAISKKLEKIKGTLKGAHLVNLTLKNGEKIQNVFIADRTLIAGIYNRERLDFSGSDIEDIEAVDLNQPQDFSEKNWLKFQTV